MNSGNRTVLVAVVSVFGALAAADAGHEDEDSFKSNWLVAEVYCRADATADATSTLPEHFAMPASAQLHSNWASYQDCESR